jgi:hypothetical protein
MEIASTHKISTDEIDEKDNIASGKFTLKVEIIPIPSASRAVLSRLFSRRLMKRPALIFPPLCADIRIQEVLTIESKTPGKKGEIVISGDQELLKSIGLVTGMKPGDKEGAGLLFDQRHFTSYMGTAVAGTQSGSLDVSKDGRR